MVFLQALLPKKTSVPLKRFLVLRGKKLQEKHPSIFNTFCQVLVNYLKSNVAHTDMRNLLFYLVGQPSLLTPKIFVNAFLDSDFSGNKNRTEIFHVRLERSRCRGFEEEYPYGGKDLWKVMTKDFSEMFSGEYPDSTEALAAALEKFPTKKQLVREWARENPSERMRR